MPLTYPYAPRRRLIGLLGPPCLLLSILLSIQSAAAADIMDTWKAVAIPAPPPLQSASVESAQTALLVLDINAATCTPEKRPSCARSIPLVQHLLGEARAHHVLVIYSTGPVSPTGGPISQPPALLAPMPDEPTVHASVDKFYGSNLEQLLTMHGIHTVIVVGTSAQGAVLYTASSAAMRGLSVIVPVDGHSSDSSDMFPELYTAWHLKNAPASLSSHITLTRISVITFH